MVKESSGAGKRLLIRVFLVAFSLVFSFLSPVVVNAISSAQLYEYAQVNALFSSPGDDDCLMAMSIQSKRESRGGDVYMIGESSALSDELQKGLKNRFPDMLISAVSGLSFESDSAAQSIWTGQVLEEAERRGILVLTFGTGTKDFNIQNNIINRLAGKNIKLVFVTAYKSGSINSKGVFEERTLNARMQNLAKNNENVYLVDFAGNINSANETKYMQQVDGGYKMTPTGVDLYIRLLSGVINDLSIVNEDTDGVEGLAQVNIDFINKYHDYAQALSIAYGIPWETVMAQGILESASGTSTFAKERHNFFGIAAYDSNTDAAYRYDDDEQGWKGYYENIRITSVYRNNGVFQGATVTDPYEYLVAIKQAGYATSETYVQNVSPIIKSIEEYSKKKGWLSSVALAAQHPEWYRNAEKNAEGGNASNVSTTAASPYCSLENSNGTYPPTVAGESDRPITNVKFSEMASVACDSRTFDMGVFEGYHQGQKVSVRLCKLNKTGYQITCHSSECRGTYGFPTTGGEYVSVNSVVSGAFAALAHQYYIEKGKPIEGANGFRSNAYQTKLYNCYKTNSCNNGNKASEPGYSPHQAGFAVDFETGCGHQDPGKCGNEMDNWLSKYAGRWINDVGAFGLTRNTSSEAWHVQLPTTDINRMKAL